MDRGAGYYSETHPRLSLSPTELEPEEMNSTRTLERRKAEGTPEEDFSD